MTNALGQITTFDSYDDHGRLMQETDPVGLVTTYTYDLLGRVTAVTRTPIQGAARTTAYTYDAAGQLETVTTPEGITLTYGYDAAHDLKTVTDGLGGEIRYQYDLSGNRTDEDVHDPLGSLVRQVDTAYDLRNRVESINRAGSITDLVYDAVGNLTSATDPNTNATAHSHDALGRLTETLDALSGVTDYGYDVQNHLISVTAPNGATTTYEYDDLGNLLEETSPDRGLLTYTHDGAGNPLTRIDAAGTVFVFTYDAANRLTSVEAPGTADDVTYTYDSCSNGTGRLCSVATASKIESYAYDAFGNITSHQGVSYTHDGDDRLETITYPSGAVVTYSYDASGSVSQVDLLADGQSQTLASSIDYLPFGPMTGLSYGNGKQLSESHDLQYRVTAQAIPGLLDFGYGYDPAGNITSRTDTIDGNSAFSYDGLNRLDTAAGPFGSRDYSYDGNGNRTSLVDGGGTTSYTYTAGSNRMASETGWLHTLDANGNHIERLEDPGTGLGFYYTYNQNNRLIQVTERTVPSTDVVLGEYAYNGLGQRIEKLVDGVATGFIYGVEGRLLAEVDGTGAVIREYVYLNGRLLALLDQVGGVTEVAYVHNDHLATPIVMSDESGTEVWRAGYDPFGAVAIDSGSTTELNVRFPGQYFDAESGMHYNYFRTYDPSTGRYLEADPLGVAPGASPTPMLPTKLGTYLKSLPVQGVLVRGLNHSYTYVENNPLNLIDPLGLYGTTNCSYYQQRCEQLGGVYYCYLAPTVCENTPPGPWANCVRQCLQEFDQGYCETDNCGGGSDVPCVVNIHQMCWQECVGGGPPVTYP